MKPTITVSAISSTPRWAIAVAAIICFSHPFFAYVLYRGMLCNHGLGDMKSAYILGGTLALELFMLAGCWLTLFWFLFGKVCLEVEPERLSIRKHLLGFCKRGESIPIHAQSRLRMLTRTVMNASLAKGAPATQKQVEIAVADNRYHLIMTFHDRSSAVKLLRELHRAYPALPMDEDGTFLSEL